MLILFHLLFINFCSCADPMPLLQTTCDAQNQIFNTSEYGCNECPPNFTKIENVCRPINATFVIANSNPVQYNISCPEGYTELGLVCFQNGAIEEHINYLKDAFLANYYDVLTNENPKEFSQISTQINDEYLEQYAYAELFHSADTFNQTAVSLLSNACSVFNYDLRIYSCNQFYSNFSQGGGNKYNYLFWPASGPFITYGLNTPLRYISEEDYVTKYYNLGDYISFQLARFSQYGEFKGFSKLDIDFNKCGDSMENIDNSQKFGYNYYSECLVDLDDLITSDSTDLFDPFIEDGTYNGKTILRPVPVISKNYRDFNGQSVNRGKEESNYKAVRRFFMNDNYTSELVVQHLKSFKITFNLKSKDKHRFLPPIITVEYSQVRRDEINKNDFILHYDKETVSTPKYTLQIQYIRNMRGFWQAVIIVFSLLMAVGFIYFFIFLIISIRIYGVDGKVAPAILNGFGQFFDIMGTILFIVCFIFSIYVFIFFKFQHSSYICLPEESEYKPLIPTLLAALCLKFCGAIFLILVKANTNVFIIDWEDAKDEDVPISGWRRIMVANEWCRLLTVRHYNVPFTVLAMAFIFGGFNLNLLGTPIPSVKLIDMDKEYYILKFAFYSFVWLLLILFQYLISKFVLWKIFGDPFLNFIDLCSTSNVSVFIRMCSVLGYYIHGMNPNLSSDQDLDELSENLRKEKNGDVPKRGLGNDGDDQVFKVFLAEECRTLLNELYNSQLAETGAPSALNLKNHIAADIQHTAYEINKEVNDFLRGFFNKENEDFDYTIQPESFIQNIFDVAPIVIEVSLLMTVNESRYNNSLLCGIEWKLQLLYLLIFVCILIPINSPCIPAIIVFLIDFIVIKIFNLIGRSNLSKKMLLDDRFFL